MILLITGSTGIAAATAKLAAASGASIFIVSNDEASCEILANEIKASGGSCEYFIGDLIEENTAIEAVKKCTNHYQRIDALFNVVGISGRSFGDGAIHECTEAGWDITLDTNVKKCTNHYQRIDALFNVAGISGRRFGDGAIHECTEAGWDITLDTNVKSMFFMCRETIKQMLQQNVGEADLRGTILNTSSVLAFSPEPKNFASHAYAASKGAIISLSQSMAAYYAPHKIRVNVIAPALIRTPMSLRAQKNSTIQEFIKTKQPLVEDLIDAEEVAKAAMFLLSDASRNITGDILKVDGGWSVS